MTMPPPLSLLLVEDNPGDVALVREALRECAASTQLTHVATLTSACEAARRSRPDAILLDLNLPDSAGVQSVSALRDQVPRVPIVVFTGLADDETGLEAVRVGAQDYLVKGRVDGAAILRAVWYAIERTHIEERLLGVTEALEASNRALDEFASVASHDLREPLAKIVTLARLLLGDGGRYSDEDRSLLEEIVSSGRRMQRLTDALLGYARTLGASRVDAAVNLGSVLGTVVEDLAVRITALGARIDVSPLPCVVGDRVQLQQVFQNLLSNALKFSRPDARPIITVTASVDTGARTATIVVGDNGVGFSVDDAERLFRPFSQLGRDRNDGVGLGLAIAKRIIDRHGGRITALGEVGRGATFTLTLGLAPDACGEEPV